MEDDLNKTAKDFEKEHNLIIFYDVDEKGRKIIVDVQDKYIHKNPEIYKSG